MTEAVTLLLSSGNGPGECRLALGHLWDHITRAAVQSGLGVDAKAREARHGPTSIVLRLTGPCAESFADQWEGVVLWRATSPLRPRHKRKNWFVQVFRLPQPVAPPDLDANAVTFTSLRAGGPGGQHQNTTESAVRATWQGYTVTVRSERSQHQNKRIALTRLAALIASEQSEAEASAKGQGRQMHHDLQRGGPRHVFQGPTFQRES